MSVFAANITVGTLALAAVYALIGSGFVVLFRATGVINFAQGAYMVLGATVFYSLVTRVGLNLYAGLVAAVIVLGFFGAGTYYVVFSRMLGASQLTMSVATIGLGILLQTVVYIVWGPNVKDFAGVIGFGTRVLPGGFTATPATILAVVLAIIVVGFLAVWLHFARTGVQMRATADEQSLAAYFGIRVGLMSALAWAVASGTAAAGGIAYSLAHQLDPAGLPSLGLVIFPAIILGGIDSLSGVVVGALALALVASLIGAYVGGEWQDPVSYALLLGVLMFRPQGLFGSPQVARL